MEILLERLINSSQIENFNEIHHEANLRLSRKKTKKEMRKKLFLKYPREKTWFNG